MKFSSVFFLFRVKCSRILEIFATELEYFLKTKKIDQNKINRDKYVLQVYSMEYNRGIDLVEISKNKKFYFKRNFFRKKLKKPQKKNEAHHHMCFANASSGGLVERRRHEVGGIQERVRQTVRPGRRGLAETQHLHAEFGEDRASQQGGGEVQAWRQSVHGHALERGADRVCGARRRSSHAC